MSGLEILGGIAAGLQIIQQVWSLGARIFDKPKDTKALAEIRTAAQNYSAQLLSWEANLKEDALPACQQFRNTLDDVVQQIDGLKSRKKRAKVFTALKLYKPDFQEKFTNALTEFTVRMCVQSQKSVDEMDGELKGMTKMMEELRISSIKLEGIPGMECAFVAIQEKMERLAEDMEMNRTTAQQTQHAMHELQNTVTAIVPQFERAITSDGELTRATVAESTTSLFEHINKRLDLNDSLTRIKAEVVPNPQSLVWHEGAEKGPVADLRVWSLDNNSDDADGSGPNAEYEGRDLLSCRLNETVETVYANKHIADDVDELIRDSRRCRADDVSAYFGLAKRGKYFEELREYMPPAITERYKDIPHEIRRQALQIARRIGQEHYYVVLDRILQQKADTLPKLSAIESMERAMLATSAEKLNVTLGFYQRHTIDDRDYLSRLRVNISSVGYKISSEEYPCRYQLNDTERSKYTNDRAITEQKVAQKIRSTGSRGLGEILRMSLAIFTHFHRPQDPQGIRGDEGIEDMFTSLFKGKRQGSHDAYLPISQTHSLLSHRVPWDESEEFRHVGGLIWDQCIISTPSSQVEYYGPHLLKNYARSAAFAHLKHGEINEARGLLAKVALEEDLRLGDHWDELLLACGMGGQYDVALEVAEKLVASYPNVHGAWIRLFNVYERMDDLHGVITRFKQALDQGHFACLWSLATSYISIDDDVNAITTFEELIKVNPTDAFLLWGRIASIYEFKLQDYKRAVEARHTQLAMPQPNAGRSPQRCGDAWESLGSVYRKMGCFDEAIKAYECSLDLKDRIETVAKIAETYFENGDHNGAFVRVKSEIIKSPEDEQLRVLLGDLFTRRGDHEAAVEVYEASINEWVQENRVPTTFWKFLGGAKRLNGDLFGAIHALETALARDPGCKGCWRLLEETYVEMGDSVGADDIRRRGEARLGNYWSSDSESSDESDDEDTEDD